MNSKELLNEPKLWQAIVAGVALYFGYGEVQQHVLKSDNVEINIPEEFKVSTHTHPELVAPAPKNWSPEIKEKCRDLIEQHLDDHHGGG